MVDHSERGEKMKKLMFSVMMVLVGTGFAAVEEVKDADVQKTELQQLEDADSQGRRFRRRRFQAADGENTLDENEAGRRGGLRRRAAGARGRVDAKQRKYRKHPELRAYFEKYPDVREDLEHNRELWKELSSEERTEQCRLWRLRNPQAAELMKPQIAGQECAGMMGQGRRFKGKDNGFGKGQRGNGRGNGRKGRRMGNGFRHGMTEPVADETAETAATVEIKE
jgi:hypothetical protein